MPITANFPKSGPIHPLPGHRNWFRMARLGQLCKVLSFFFIIPYGVSWSLTCRMPIIVNTAKNYQTHHPSGHRNRFWMAKLGQFGKVLFLRSPFGISWSSKCRLPIIVNVPKIGQIHDPSGYQNRLRMARLSQFGKVLSFFDSLLEFHEVWHVACQ